jgi:hypothetical protein
MSAWPCADSQRDVSLGCTNYIPGQFTFIHSSVITPDAAYLMLHIINYRLSVSSSDCMAALLARACPSSDQAFRQMDRCDSGAWSLSFLRAPEILPGGWHACGAGLELAGMEFLNLCKPGGNNAGQLGIHGRNFCARVTLALKPDQFASCFPIALWIAAEFSTVQPQSAGGRQAPGC